MKPSEQLWEELERQQLNTRGEATEMFADALTRVLQKQLRTIKFSNGSTIDVLSAALDYVTESNSDLMTEFDGFLEEIKEEF